MVILMEFRERILTTMDHEEPDRVPVMSLLNEPSNVFQFLEKASVPYFNYLKKPLLKDLTRVLMNRNWLWNRDFFNVYKKVVDVSIQLGFDATWLLYLIFKLRRNKEFPLGMAWYDPWGRIWEVQVDKHGNPEPYYSRGYGNTEDRWREWSQKQLNFMKKFPGFAEAFHRKINDACGNRIFVVGFAGPGIFENSWQPIGFTEFIKFIYEKPRFVEEVIEFHAKLFMELVKSVCKAGNEIILIGDDLGHKTGPFLSPTLIDQYFGEYYRQVVDYIHKQGKKVIFHSCGKIYKLLDQFIEYGIDGILTLEPTADMDLARVRTQVGHKLVLIGNLDVSYLLVRGSQKEIRDAVKKAIKDAAPGGGFILAPAHNHSEVDATRLQWMVEAAHKFGQYPLQF